MVSLATYVNGCQYLGGLNGIARQFLDRVANETIRKKRGCYRISVRQSADLLSCSPKSVQRASKKLQELGLLGRTAKTSRTTSEWFLPDDFLQAAKRFASEGDTPTVDISRKTDTPTVDILAPQLQPTNCGHLSPKPKLETLSETELIETPVSIGARPPSKEENVGVTERLNNEAPKPTTEKPKPRGLEPKVNRPLTPKAERPTLPSCSVSETTPALSEVEPSDDPYSDSGYTPDEYPSADPDAALCDLGDLDDNYLEQMADSVSYALEPIQDPALEPERLHAA